VRSRFGVRETSFGSGLVLILTVAFSVVAVLAGAGIVIELSGTRTIVFTQQPTTLVASQEATGLDVHEDADESDPAENDPAADPGGEHAETHPDTVAVRSTDVKRGDAVTVAPRAEASPRPATSPEAVASAPAPEPAPAGGTAVAAEEPPKPAARVRPTPAPRGPPRPSADVPIVMYHYVGPLPPNADVYRRDLTVSPDLFEQTLAKLADQGVETATMADLFEHFAGGQALPKRSVILTFDDGYDNAYEHAFRLLKAHKMVGTFFVTTDFVERPGYLTWAQIAEMADAGMEIAAHSANHPDFTKIGPNELKRQLAEPKAVLEEHLRQPVRFMAYPAGKYNPAVMAATRAAGYEAAVTVLHGTRHVPANAFELRRVRARGTDSVNEIVGRMTPATWRQ
jgi:peptidoglycan/xylan/chitin deacetylase (PgdA/CDA1 family)